MNDSDGASAGGNTCLYRGATQLSTAEMAELSTAALARNGNAYWYPVAYNITSTSYSTLPSSNLTPERVGISSTMPGLSEVFFG